MARILRIGIDLGASVLRVVWTTTHRGRLSWHWAQQSVAPTHSPEELHKALRQLLRPFRAVRYHIPVHLAANASHVRHIVVQIPSLQQLDAALAEQIPRLFPFESARCHARTHLVSQRPINGQLACTVQAAACDVHALEQDLAVLRQVGWIPSEVVPRAFAIWALANSQRQLTEQPTVLLELGERQSVLVIATQTQVLFARELSIGVDFLSEALTAQVTVGQDQVQLAREEAQSLVASVGIPESGAEPAGGRLPAATYQALIQPVLDQWAGEIERTIAFNAHDHPEAIPRTVLLCGAGTSLRGLSVWLTGQVELPVSVMGVRPLLEEEHPALAVACGLLLLPGSCAVNLLPDSLAQARRYLRGVRLATTALLLVLVGIWLGIGVQTRQLRHVSRDIEPIRLALAELEPIRSIAQAVHAQRSVVSALVGSALELVAWLGRLPEQFPAAIRLTELSLDAQQIVQLSGQAEAHEQSADAQVSEFAIWLEQAGLCREVRLGQTERQSADESLVTFSLSCRR